MRFQGLRDLDPTLLRVDAATAELLDDAPLCSCGRQKGRTRPLCYRCAKEILELERQMSERPSNLPKRNKAGQLAGMKGKIR